MSKKEVLEQVYPDELDYIFNLKREKELHRYEGYLNQVMAAAAVFGGGDSIKDYIEGLLERIRMLSEDEFREEKPKDLDSELDKLRTLQSTIAQNQKKKRR